jgi:hypothetical protein
VWKAGWWAPGASADPRAGEARSADPRAPRACARHRRPMPHVWGAAGIRGGRAHPAVHRPAAPRRHRDGSARLQDDRGRSRGGRRVRAGRRCRRKPPSTRRTRTPSRYARHEPPAPAASGRSSRTRSRRGRRYDAGARGAESRAGAARHRTPTANPPEGCPGSGPRPGAGAGCCRGTGCSSSGGRSGRRCRRGRRWGAVAWRRSPCRQSFVSVADRWRPLPGTAPRPARRSPVAPERWRPVGPRHRMPGDPRCPDRRTSARRSPRTPASRTRRTSPDPAPPGLVGCARRTPASRCPRSSARPARRSPARPARRLPGAPTARTVPSRARPRPPSAAGPASVGSSGVEESRRDVLRCSCTPRFLMSGPFGRARALVGVAGREDGRPGTHTRTEGPASRRGGDGGRTALRACASLYGLFLGEREPVRQAGGICPERPPTLR